MIEKISRMIAEQYFLGYNEGYCSSIGYVFKGSVTQLVDKNWKSFIKIAENIIGELKDV